MGAVAFDFAGDEVAADDSARFTVDDDEVEHLATNVRLNLAGGDLAVQGRVSAKKELLSGLTASVEGSGDLRAAEGAVREKSAVFAREGDALRDALVDDQVADLGETVDVRFASAIVAALDRVVEEAVDGVVVVLVVLRGVDAALRGDRVRATRAVGDAEDFDVVAEFAERRGGGSARESRADDDNIELALVVRIDDANVGLVIGPLFSERTFWNPGVQFGFNISHDSIFDLSRFV